MMTATATAMSLPPSMACIRQSFLLLHSHPTDLPTYLLATPTFHIQARKFGTFSCGGTHKWLDRPLQSSQSKFCQAVISIHTNKFLEPPAGHQICSDTCSSPLSRVELHILLPKRFLGIHREPHILRPSHSLGESPVRLSTSFYILFSSTMGIAHAK